MGYGEDKGGGILFPQWAWCALSAATYVCMNDPVSVFACLDVSIMAWFPLGLVA